MPKPRSDVSAGGLYDVYEDRWAAVEEARASGRPVVGLIGAEVPRELVLAAGATPVSITAGPPRPTPTADIYLDDLISPEDHDLFEAAVEGRFEALDLLVLSRSYQRLFYFLKEIYRLGRAPKLPPVCIFDLMPSQREAVRAYNLGCFERLAEQVGRAAGRAVDDAALSDAIRRMNAVRAGWRRVQALRDAGGLGGSEALRILGAARFMTPEAYLAGLQDWFEARSETPLAAAAPGLLVVSSEPLTTPHLHDVLEGGGTRVLAEDDVWGARCATPDIPTDARPMTALLESYWLGGAGRDVYPPAQADRWFDQQLSRPDIDAVVFYLPPSDHKLGWDFPRLAQKAAAAGKAHRLIREDLATPAGLALEARS